ncbi:type II toxin-antitoxin system VapC family toxin [Methylobacterium sp. DB0501]|nr:type II toxin-antitoxin system VapC family toxin [Methylobacterium sp. DB0501]
MRDVHRCSASTAILAGEPDAAALVARLQQAHQRVTSPLAVWETKVALARILNLPLTNVQRAMRDYLTLASVEVVALPPRVADGAIEAFDRYGKGRHPAGLNFGDCFACACAQIYRMPLLFKGDDFPLIDIPAA